MVPNVRTATLFSVLLNFVASDLILTPKDIETVAGQSAYLNCSTTNRSREIQWFHYHVGAGEKGMVYGWGEVRPPYTGRFLVKWINSTGVSTLEITTVAENDAGIFVCVDDVGVGQTAQGQLIVLSTNPECQSSALISSAIGTNSCGFEPDTLHFSCTVNYKSNTGFVPVLEWTNTGRSDPIKEGITYSNYGNRVTYNLTVNVSSTIDRNTYICQTTRSSALHQYQCSTKEVKVLHITNDFTLVKKSVGETITCSTDGSLSSCNYKWVRSDVAFSSDRSMNATNPGLYRCEAECQIRSKLCTLTSGLYHVTGGGSESQVTQSAEAAAGSQSFKAAFIVLLIILIVLIIAFVILAVFFRKRKEKRRERISLLNRDKDDMIKNLKQDLERQHELHLEDKRKDRDLFTQAEGEWDKAKDILLKQLQDYKNDLARNEYNTNPILIRTIKTRVAEVNDKSIRGLAVLNNDIFLISQKESEVEIYDSTTLEFLRRWTLAELSNPEDATACPRNRCIYICDNKETGNEILRVGPNGDLIKNWTTGDKIGRLSVTDKTHVLLLIHDTNKLMEFSAVGQLIQTIDLSEFGITSPMHALTMKNGNFVVTSGYMGNEQRVCEIDVGEKKVIKSFGSGKGCSDRQMCNPTYLAIDRDGSIMVADASNGRVILLDSNLEFKREIVTKSNGIHIPTRIAIDELNGRLHVSDRTIQALHIFKIK